MTQRIKGFYQLVYHKYVDELYDALFVNRIKDLGRACFFVDSKFVDGAVNGNAPQPRGEPRSLSRLFDKYIVDGLVNLVGWINMRLNRIATSFQTGLAHAMAVFGNCRIYFDLLQRFAEARILEILGGFLENSILV